MKKYSFINSKKNISYVNSYGELHISECASKFIEKVKSEGYNIADSKINGHFYGTVIASDL